MTNIEDRLYLAIKYMQDNDLTTQDIANILQISIERLKEFVRDYE